MTIISELAGAEPCTFCLLPAEQLTERHGDKLCQECITLLWFAEVLSDSDVDEAEVISTLAFAAYAGELWDIRDQKRREETTKELAGEHAGFDVVKVFDGVPVLRMKSAIAEVVTYPGSSLTQRLRIRILSRVAKPEEAARMYGARIEQEGLPVFDSSPGSFYWEFADAHLVVSVGPREDIEPFRLAYLDEYPQVYRFSFPLSSVVEALLRGLLGRGQKKNQMFAALLGDHGRSTTMQSETSIPACVLLRLLRARSKTGRDPESAAILNRHLMEPLDKPLVTLTSYDTVWRDAVKVSHRFDLACYLLQELQTRDNFSNKRLSTTS